MIIHRPVRLIPLLLVAPVLLSQGCAVPQRPGKGLCARLVEPTTRTGYWLYLPEDYVKNQGQHPAGERWPMVVTFHGLRPYDDANPQIREWQQESDRYNFIVIAPELRTCDSLTMQFPLKDPELPYVKQDERAILSILDEVTRRTDADPGRVLATSFSSGGYMAHFMVNRHPERFSCLAVRGSNFQEALLNPSQVPKYRNMKVGIFFGENDFKVCADESMKAVDWYRRHRFDVVAKKVGGLGHERRPEVAAALFAESIGVAPKTPPDLGMMVMKDVMPEGVVRRQPRQEAAPRSPGSSEPIPTQGAVFSPTPQQPASPAPVVTSRTPARTATAQPAPVQQRPPTPTATRIVPRKTETPKRPAGQADPTQGRVAPRSNERTRPGTVFSRREQGQETPVGAGIRVHGEAQGRAPMWVSLSVDIPDQYRDGAGILWTVDERPIQATNSFEARALLKTAGEHLIQAHILTADDRKIVLNTVVKVLAPASQPAS